MGGKEQLFARAAVPEPDAPVSCSPDQAAEQLLVALADKLDAAIRTMLTHTDAADSVRTAMPERQHQAARHLAGADADLRAGLIGALAIGVVIARHLLRLDSLSDAAPGRITDLLARPSTGSRTTVRRRPPGSGNRRQSASCSPPPG